jgi:hypothetical protein
VRHRAGAHMVYGGGVVSTAYMRRCQAKNISRPGECACEPVSVCTRATSSARTATAVRSMTRGRLYSGDTLVQRLPQDREHIRSRTHGRAQRRETSETMTSCRRSDPMNLLWNGSPPPSHLRRCHPRPWTCGTWYRWHPRPLRVHQTPYSRCFPIIIAVPIGTGGRLSIPFRPFRTVCTTAV